MRNYAVEWKKFINFKQVDYKDFLDQFNGKKFYYSQKIDGQLAAFVYERNGDCFLQTTSGAEIRNISLTYEYKSILDRHIEINSAVIIGELAAVKNGKLLSFSESESIIKTHHRGDNGSFIFHFLYDVFEINDKKIQFKESLNILQKMFKKNEKIIVLGQIYGGIETFNKVWETLPKSPGIEGVVARDPSGKTYKIKEILTLDLAVIGAGNPEMISWKRQEISYLLVAFFDKGLFHLSSKVGSGFKLDERKYFYNFCMDNKVNELKNGDILIKPSLITEIEFNVLFKNNMRRFKYDGKLYTEVDKSQGYTMRHPRYVRVRDDKKINDFDCGYRQIPEGLR